MRTINNGEKAPEEKLSIPYMAGIEIAKRKKISTTPDYVRSVIYRHNKGIRLTGKKSKAIIKAVKAYK